MVKRCIAYALLFFSICPGKVGAATNDISPSDEIRVDIPAKVTVEIPQSYENQPITGVITIIREFQQKVDESSFTLDDKPLKVELIHEAQPETNYLFPKGDPEAPVLARYRFSCPPRPPGLYLINPVYVKVGKMVVRSSSTSVQVSGAVSSHGLRMDAKILETPPIYEGQKVTFQYHIYFSDPIELAKEDLSLFTFEGFRTVGAPKIETYAADGETVQAISQSAVAEAVGTLQSKPSVIEGYVYKSDSEGKKTYFQPLLRAEAPSIQVEVLPFPEKDRPASFTGAIGVYSWKARLISSASVGVGEKLQLEITAVGQGDLDTVSLPNLAKEKGFRDAFRLSDTTPAGEIIGNTKRFVVELKPLSNEVKKIPEMEFSSFDPIFKRYIVVRVPSIPITVRTGKVATAKEREKRVELAPIEIERNVILTQNKLAAPKIGIWFFVGVLLVLGGLFGAQMIVRQWILSRRVKKKETSRELILEALKQRSSPQISYPLVQRALLLRLYEVGETATCLTEPEALLQTGIQGEIRKFLSAIQEKRFSPVSGSLETKEVLEEASHLYYQLKNKETKATPINGYFIIFFCLWNAFLSSETSFHDDGYTKYVEAERTEKPEVRKRDFNEALSFYLHAAPDAPSGELLYNIGNCYYQLGEYGLALLYYYRAEKVFPRDEKVVHNIQVALNKTGLQEYSSKGGSVLFSFLNRLSFYEKELFCLAFLVAAFVFASLALWIRIQTFTQLAVISMVFSILCSFSLLWTLFLSPIEAVIVQPGVLFAGPGRQYVVAVKKPMIPGLKIRVDEIVDNGAWLKIVLPTGETGYISKEQGRII